MLDNFPKTGATNIKLGVSKTEIINWSKSDTRWCIYGCV